MPNCMNFFPKQPAFCWSKIWCVAAYLVLGTLIGCGDSDAPTSGEGSEGGNDLIAPLLETPAANDAGDTGVAEKKPVAMGKMNTPPSAAIKFKDSVESNASHIPKKLDELVFTDKHGTKIALLDFQGKKNVVLVFTEGFNGMLCPFCQTQTSRLIANYEKFKALDTEILVVYPGKRDHLDEFIKTALTIEKKQVDKVPFPVVLDEDFKATDFFDIHSMHAHPSTFVIDKSGSVQLAYVGADMTADRPSVKAILDKLELVNDADK